MKFKKKIKRVLKWKAKREAETEVVECDQLKWYESSEIVTIVLSACALLLIGWSLIGFIVRFNHVVYTYPLSFVLFMARIVSGFYDKCAHILDVLKDANWSNYWLFLIFIMLVLIYISLLRNKNAL
ncbi:hypothetical protein BGC07_17200 [Piscirickettsia litoralis]|uniref:Uncharacterized protein n=1 Tax=Piscirickettsia litoralis TaxID=1891921 RepID=A0ABX3A1L9_9GAMM|nr:hypothetical protein BGC07_17200 [Piscirickettsia litoralis]